MSFVLPSVVGALTGAQYEAANRPERVGDESLDALLRFVDELIDSARRDAPSTEPIRRYYSDEQVAEIVLLVGHYLMTALFIKTLGIQPETPTEPKGVADHDL
jgi:hypothetical protein